MGHEGNYPSLAGLRQELSIMNWQLALPSGLTDNWLTGLAKDSRILDGPLPIGADSLRPLLFVAYVASARARARNTKVSVLEECGAKTLLTANKFVLEREVDSRKIGVPSLVDETEFPALVDLTLAIEVLP